MSFFHSTPISYTVLPVHAFHGLSSYLPARISALTIIMTPSVLGFPSDYFTVPFGQADLS